MTLAERTRIIAGYAAWGVGVLIGLFVGVLIGLFVGSARLKTLAEIKISAIEADVDRKLEPWRIKLDPRVLKAVDIYGFDHNCRRQNDTRRMTADEIFYSFTEFAYDRRVKREAETGAQINMVDITGDYWTLNRCLTINTQMTFRKLPDSETAAPVHPAAEQERWQHLDKALKCFLN